MILSTIQGVNFVEASKHILSLRCPACRQQGTFESFSFINDLFLFSNAVLAGERFCPNPKCKAHVFVVFDDHGKILKSYPPEKIDFDPSHIPEKIIAMFEEAVTCYSANCHMAAAIMIRKTLEELCFHQGADGDQLKQKLLQLQGKVVLPVELMAGLDGLRLLSDEAAYIRSREFNKISSEELAIGIELTKEVLKAVYQYSDLLKRLKALKK